jgi:hypothetical protein
MQGRIGSGEPDAWTGVVLPRCDRPDGNTKTHLNLVFHHGKVAPSDKPECSQDF